MEAAIEPGRVHTYADLEAVSLEAARIWAEQALTCVGRCGAFRVALSGGQTPQALFRRLAEPRFRELPWDRTEVFWVDERYVPYEHAQSNFGAARELLLSRVPVPPDRIHPMPTASGDPARDASDYEGLLRRLLAPGQAHSFDLCLLGLGEDGHTASLFPGAAELGKTERWVVASRSPKGIVDRITLTLPILLRSRLNLFLVCGRGKAAAVKTLLGPMAQPPLPGQLVWRGEAHGALLLDQEAALPIASASGRA